MTEDHTHTLFDRIAEAIYPRVAAMQGSGFDVFTAAESAARAVLRVLDDEARLLDRVRELIGDPPPQTPSPQVWADIVEAVRKKGAHDG